MGLHLAPVMGTSQLSPNHFSWEKGPILKFPCPYFWDLRHLAESWTGSRHKFPGQPLLILPDLSVGCFLGKAAMHKEAGIGRQDKASSVCTRGPDLGFGESSMGRVFACV